MSTPTYNDSVFINCPFTALKRVHSWLNTASHRKTIPGEKMLQIQFEEFELALPDLVAGDGYNMDNLPFLNLLDFIHESVSNQLP